MSNGYWYKLIFLWPCTFIFFQVRPWKQILLQLPTRLVNVYRTVTACPMVTINLVKPVRDMYPVPMVSYSTTDPALTIVLVRNLLCGMMWRNAVSTRARHVHQTPKQHVSQTVVACLMVTISLVKPVRNMYPVQMVTILTDPALTIVLVRNLLCGMMWRNAVSTRAQLAHQTHQQLVRLSHQALAPQQQSVLLEHLTLVSRTVVAFSMVIISLVKPVRNMYPVQMVTISIVPALTIFLVRNHLCGMMRKNAVSTRAQLAHQPHQQLVRLSHQAPAPQQQLVLREHLTHVSRTVVACSMVTISLVKPVRNMYPVQMVTISTDPVLIIFLVRNLLCGMMWRNAVSTRAQRAHQTHQQLVRLSHQAPAPQQQLVLLEHLTHVFQTVVAWLTVIISLVKPARDMFPVRMVTISTDPAPKIVPVRNHLCGMMWRNVVSTRAQLAHHTHQQLFRLSHQALAPQQQLVQREHLTRVSQTVVACSMVTISLVKPVRNMYPVQMVTISTDPVLIIFLVRNLLCGMMWRNAVSTRAQRAHQTHQQLVRLSHQAPAPQQQLVLREHLTHVFQTVVACSMVTISLVKPARDMFPVRMVTISTDPAPKIVPVRNLLCGMMWRNAVSTRAQLAHQPHQQLVRLSHQALAPQQQLVLREHLTHVSRIVVACSMVTISLVKPVRNMYPVQMVTISTDPVLIIFLVRNLLCGMMWRNAVSTRAQRAHQTHQQLVRLSHQAPAPQQQLVLREHLTHVFQTVVACSMVTISLVKPARDMFPVRMVTISTDPAPKIVPVRNLLCGMMWRNAVSTRAQLAHQPHQQLVRLSHQALAPQQQLVLREHLTHVSRIVVACSMVTISLVKPVRNMYPVQMVTISTDPALIIFLVRNFLCGMMWKNAVSTRAQRAHQTHQQLVRLSHQAPAPQQQLVLLEHLAHVYPIVGICRTVPTHHVTPTRDMWPAKMVCFVRKSAQLVKCGMMWRKTAWDT